MRVDTLFGPWLSLGLHIDFKHRHVDLHFLWWTIVIGNTKPPYYCGVCLMELDESALNVSDFVCPYCGV